MEQHTRIFKEYRFFEFSVSKNIFKKVYLFHQRTGSSNGGVKTFDVTVRKLYTWHGG